MSLDLTDFQNKKYAIRCGGPVRLLCVDAPGGYPVVGIVGNGIFLWNMRGESSTRFGDCDEYDLINAKTKKEGWVNVWKHNEGKYRFTGQSIYDRPEDALIDRMGAINVACIKIEWEE